MNSAAIRYDCGETRACLDQEDMKPAGDFVNTCINMEADQFADHPETQAGFLSTTRRCAPFSGCEYFNCTRRQPPETSFGLSRASQITYGCQQKIQCELMQGKSFPDPNIEVNNCVGATEGTFYNFGLAEQTAYDDMFASCSSLSACMFVTCYQY